MVGALSQPRGLLKEIKVRHLTVLMAMKRTNKHLSHNLRDMQLTVNTRPNRWDGSHVEGMENDVKKVGYYVGGNKGFS